MKIYIDEYYPFRGIADDDCAGSDSFDIPKDKEKWIREVMSSFDDVQEYLEGVMNPPMKKPIQITANELLQGAASRMEAVQRAKQIRLERISQAGE